MDAFPSPFRDGAPDQAFELQDLAAPTRPLQPRPHHDTEREQKRRQKLEQLREADDMKFSHSLQFNAVPDWSNHYIAYSNLKKQYVSACNTDMPRASRLTGACP